MTHGLPRAAQFLGLLVGRARRRAIEPSKADAACRAATRRDKPEHDLVAMCSYAPSRSRAGTRRSAPDGLDLPSQLLRTFYRHVAPEDLLEREPVDLYGAAMSQLRLAADRPAGHGSGHGVHAERRRARVVRRRSHRRRGRHRRHAVPRRLGHDGAHEQRAATSTWSSTRSSWSAATSPASCRRSATSDRVDDDEPRRLRESWMHIEIDRESADDELDEIDRTS